MYIVVFDERNDPNSKWHFYIWGNPPIMNFASQPGSQNSNSQPPLQLDHSSINHTPKGDFNLEMQDRRSGEWPLLSTGQVAIKTFHFLK